MSEDKSFGKKLDRFFDGKGFYIVLSLCIALLGVSAYFLLTGGDGTDVEDALGEQYETDAEVRPSEAVTETPAVNDEDEETSETDGEEETPVWNEEEADAAVTAAMIWPVDGEIVLPYSMTSLVYNERLGDWRTNDGVNISAPLGTQVLACGSGIIEKVYMDDMNGMTVVIEHAGGLKSIYSNLAAVPTVCEGDNVMTGEVIGSVGATALGVDGSDPYLCFSMTLDGQSVDPAAYLPLR